MPKMVITHSVADVDAWLGFKAERAEAIAALGGSNVVEHVALDGAKSVALSADVADVDAMMAALGSPPPEIAAVMEKHGVLPPLVAFVEGQPTARATVGTPLPREIGRPATGALLNLGITTLEQVALMSERELLGLHGVGPKAVRLLKQALDERGLQLATSRDAPQ